MKRLLLLMCGILSMVISAFAADGDEFSYTYKGQEIKYIVTSEAQKTCAVKSNNKVEGALELPAKAEYKGVSYSVKKINDAAFRWCSTLRSVVIPNSVQVIGESAFYDCYSLTSVKIPNSVTNIGIRAFQDCSSLASVEIPNSVQVISNLAFYGCALTSVKIPNSVTNIGIRAFQDCSSLVSVELPNSVQEIGSSAFMNCPSLASIKLPNSVSVIDSQTFEACTGLKSVAIPNSVKKIGNSAFKGCSNLVSIELPNSVQEIGSSAFSGCTNLTSVKVSSATPPSADVDSFSDETYEQATLDLPQEYIFIYNNVSPWNKFRNIKGVSGELYSDGVFFFQLIEGTHEATLIRGNYSSLTNANIPESITDNSSSRSTTRYYVTSIASDAFKNCSRLTKVVIPSSVKEIGNEAFSGCNIYDFTIPNSVKTFDMATLAGNPLKSLTVGSGVTQITGTEYFADSNLEKIFWLGNIPPVGYTGFNPVVNFVSNDKYHLSNQILYPFLSSIFEIGGIVYVPVSPAERTCNVVDYLYTPKNAKFSVPATVENKGIQMKVIDVGAYAFYHHDYLTDISLDNNGVIDDYAFYDCLKLKSVTFGGNIPEIKNHSFQNCEVLKKVENSPALTSIGRWAFSGCVGMDYFSVGEKIKSFGEEAFSDCTGLTKFYSYATTPPECGPQALDDIIKWNCTLYVPQGSDKLYSSAPQWKDFFYIEGTLESGIETIQTNGEGVTEIYDLNGIKQIKSMEHLSPGVYVVRQSNKATKIVIK